MKRFIVSTAALLALAATAGVTNLRAAGATHTTFTGGVGATNPCNGEGFSASGPVDIVYVADADASHFVVHLTFKATGVGNQGNTYRTSFVANDQFDAPTGTGGPGVTFFDVPVNGEVITKGGAPNFEWDLGIRVFVVGGQATGPLFIGPSSTTCHG
jgi:hypothetical protein